MFKPASQTDLYRYDRAVDGAIATCGGDVRGALKALIIANEYLEGELRRTAISPAAYAQVSLTGPSNKAAC